MASSGFGASIAQMYMNNMSAADMSEMSASISNASPWAAGINLVGDIFNVIGSAYQAKAQAQAVKYQYEAQALQAQFKADTGRFNAQIAAYEGTRKQIAFAQNAALSGLQAAQTMANTRVQQSHSGVRMDSTSSQQVRASQQFSRAVDMATTEQNRIELLNQSQQQVTNYLTSANLAEASADSARQAAASVSPGKAFNSSLVTGLMGLAAEEAGGMFQKFQSNLEQINLTNQSNNLSGKYTMEDYSGWFGNIDNAQSGYGIGGYSGWYGSNPSRGFGIGGGMTA